MAQQPTSGFGGFGSFLGLEPGVETRAALVQQKRKAKLDEFKQGMAEQAATVAPEHRNTFMQFARLGDMLGQKMSGGANGAALTPEEDRSIRIMETANARIKELHQSPEFQTLDPMEKSFRAQKAVADAAAEAGDYSAYSNLATDLYNKRIQYRTAEAQTAVLEGEAKTVDNKVNLLNAEAEAELSRLNKGEPVQMVRVGANGPDLSEPVTVFQSVDGVLRDESGNEVSWGEVLPVDDAIALSDARGKSGGKAFTAGDLSKQIGASNIAKLAQGLEDVDTMVAVNGRLNQALEEASDPQNIVGKQGGLLNFAADMWNLAVGTGKNLSGIRIFEDRDADGNGTGTSQSFNDSINTYISDDMVPAQFRTDAQAALKYKSAVMQLVFADARLEEPGARQLSDADIKHSMTRLGVSSGDPMAVLANLESVMQNRLNVSASRYERLGGQIDAYGLDRELTFKRLLGADPSDVINRARTTISKQNRLARNSEQEDDLINQAGAVGEGPALPKADADILDSILNR